MSEAQQVDCMDIVGSVSHQLNQLGLLDDFQFVGGIGSSILRHPGTEFKVADELMVASPDFVVDNPDLTLIRPNRTRRDLDGMVLRYDPNHTDIVSQVVEEIVQGQLEVKVFSIKDARRLRFQHDHPFGFSSLFKAWLAERYENPDGSLVKGVLPFAVPILAETLHSWTAEVNGMYFPVPHPATTVLNYATRSISGLRPKDDEKVSDMAANLVEKWPEAREWVNDGPGRTHIDLARIFQTLRWGRRGSDPRTLDVGGLFQITSGLARDLVDDEAFMFKDDDPKLQLRVLTTAVSKARLLGRTESYPKAVEIFQRFFEQKVDAINKNE